MVWQLSKRKNNRILGRDFCKATICSHFIVVLTFLHLVFGLPKTMKADAAIKKRPHEVCEIEVHTAG